MERNPFTKSNTQDVETSQLTSTSLNDYGIINSSIGDLRYNWKSLDNLPNFIDNAGTHVQVSQEQQSEIQTQQFLTQDQRHQNQHSFSHERHDIHSPRNHGNTTSNFAPSSIPTTEYYTLHSLVINKTPTRIISSSSQPSSSRLSPTYFTPFTGNTPALSSPTSPTIKDQLGSNFSIYYTPQVQSPPPEEFSSSRYEWDSSEFTPRQRRLSESRGTILTSVIPGTNMQEIDSVIVDDDERFQDEYDEEGILKLPYKK